MRLILSCPPHLADLIPEPIAAAGAIPSWLKTMPAETGEGENRIGTAKRCSPFVDVTNLGFYFRLAADVHFDGCEFHWPEAADCLETPYLSGPLSFHKRSQLDGCPLAQGTGRIVKFHNYWSVQLEPSWSLLFMHPAHQSDLPFRTISALVDVDRYCQVPVQIPATWHSRTACRLARGTPIAHCIPVKREPCRLELSAMSQEHYNVSNQMAETILTTPHAYRRRFRSKRTGSNEPAGQP